jgi:hypothetical protein
MEKPHRHGELSLLLCGTRLWYAIYGNGRTEKAMET